MNALRIAMIGLRGIPAQYGGVERHVEELSVRLVDRGHDVTVFCRHGYAPECGPTYRGVRLRELPTVHLKGAEALVHSGLGALTAGGHRFDVAHFHAMGPGLFTPWSRAFGGSAIVQTIHGLDEQRGKWGGGAQRLLRVGALLSAHVPDEVVVVSRELGEHYRERYGRYTSYVTNGVPAVTEPDLGLLADLGLTPGGYAVFVGRMVPEKAPDLLLQAYRDVPGDLPLVLVGDSSDTDGYVAQLRELAALDPRVRLVGFRYGAELAALYGGARLFVQPSLLEGLPITLLEAAAYGVPVLASDIPPHREVVGGLDAARMLFRAGDRDGLTAALTACLGADPDVARAAARRFRDEVTARYSWDVATDLLEDAYRNAVRRRRAASVPAQTDLPRELATR
ncbi:glycosyltransferase family 4 protein [Nocardioides sp. SR21]|uniref:glycosyltransferase family 4 protein n=1 Tax=Nocardioides sp. SR21 TaxID=2919501 RepID=UPI001FAAD428|nr:glycosyltransferase family 4 protein [Nocardioides sp. SR21]